MDPQPLIILCTSVLVVSGLQFLECTQPHLLQDGTQAKPGIHSHPLDHSSLHTSSSQLTQGFWDLLMFHVLQEAWIRYPSEGSHHIQPIPQLTVGEIFIYVTPPTDDDLPESQDPLCLHTVLHSRAHVSAHTLSHTHRYVE